MENFKSETLWDEAGIKSEFYNHSGVRKICGWFCCLHREQKFKKRVDDTLFMQSVLSEAVSDGIKIFLNYWIPQGL